MKELKTPYYCFEPAKSLHKLIPSMIRVTYSLLNSSFKGTGTCWRIPNPEAGPFPLHRSTRSTSLSDKNLPSCRLKIFSHLSLRPASRYLTQAVLSYDLWSTKQLHTGSKEGAEQFKSWAQAAQSRFGTRSLLFSTWTSPTLLCYQIQYLALLPCPCTTDTLAD